MKFLKDYKIFESKDIEEIIMNSNDILLELSDLDMKITLVDHRSLIIFKIEFGEILIWEKERNTIIETLKRLVDYMKLEGYEYKSTRKIEAHKPIMLGDNSFCFFVQFKSFNH